MATISIPDELSAAFSGELLEPGAPGYDDARTVHNGMIAPTCAMRSISVAARAPRSRCAAEATTSPDGR